MSATPAKNVSLTINPRLTDDEILQTVMEMEADDVEEVPYKRKYALEEKLPICKQRSIFCRRKMQVISM